MQACPTHAISFGNVNDKESDVYKIRNDIIVESKKQLGVWVFNCYVISNSILYTQHYIYTA